MFHLGYQDKRSGTERTGGGGALSLQLCVMLPRVKPYSLFINWCRRGKTSIIKRRLSYRWPRLRVIQVGPFLDRASILTMIRGALKGILNR